MVGVITWNAWLYSSILHSIDHLCKCKHRIAWIVARKRWIEAHPIHIRSWVCWDEVSWHQLLTLWNLQILYNFWIQMTIFTTWYTLTTRIYFFS
jgi:hypothetical protein